MLFDKYDLKNPINVNLQLFAEDSEEAEADELGEEIELETEADEAEAEEEPEEVQEEKEEPFEEAGQKEPEKMVPLKALEAERHKWKQKLQDQDKYIKAARKLTDATGKDIDSLLQEMDSIETQKHVESGMSEEQAKAYVAMQRKIEEMEIKQNKQKYDIEFAELKSNPFYSDAESNREDLESFANRTGLSIKQAYNALYGDLKYADMERTLEQKILNNLQKKQQKAVDVSPTAETSVKPKVNLSKDQMEIAKMAGMTPQEYYNMLNAKSLDSYQKLKKKG